MKTPRSLPLSRRSRKALLLAASLPMTLATAQVDLLDLDLEQLVNMEVKSAAGLTKTDARRIPIPLTEIDAKTIQQSGARDLNKLIENEVPNAQFVFHHGHGPHLGFRGIISDREDKYLYQVNGRTMNNRLYTGADMERGLPLLGDINKVSVVRGPASATHGAGAIAGVVNVETYNGLTFEGVETSVRHGIVDAYTAGEVKFGGKLSDDSGIFFYYGQVDREGMDSDYYIGRSFPARNGLPANVAGQPAPFEGAKLYEPSDDMQRKLHLSLVKGPLELWTRYVEDGYHLRRQREVYSSNKPAATSVDGWLKGRTVDNTQFTTALRYKEELSPTWTIDSMLSFDRYQMADWRGGTDVVNVGNYSANEENEIFGRAIAVWTPNDRHSLGFGIDYSIEYFKEPGRSDALNGAATSGTSVGRPAVTDREWDVDTISFMLEHQWKISEAFTLFASGRTDKHTYTDWLISPRGTLVYTPNDKHTLKFMLGESVRRSGDSELYAQATRSGMPAGTPAGFVPPKKISEAETLQARELSYEYAISKEWSAGVNVFHQDYSAIGWVTATGSSQPVGEFEMAGGEFTVSYRRPGTRIDFSHGVVELLDAQTGFDPRDNRYQGIGLTQYGVSDLLAWSSMISKLSVTHDITSKFTAGTSLTFYWGFDGAEDLAKHINLQDPGFINPNTNSATASNAPQTNPGNTTPYGANLYWNVGLEYRPTENWTLRIDGYNLAELFDDTISKRNYFFRMSEFSVESASLALSAKYKF